MSPRCWSSPADHGGRKLNGGQGSRSNLDEDQHGGGCLAPCARLSPVSGCWHGASASTCKGACQAGRASRDAGYAASPVTALASLRARACSRRPPLLSLPGARFWSCEEPSHPPGESSFLAMVGAPTMEMNMESTTTTNHRADAKERVASSSRTTSGVTLAGGAA
mgnify:CR=1 FL=1